MRQTLTLVGLVGALIVGAASITAAARSAHDVEPPQSPLAPLAASAVEEGAVPVVAAVAQPGVAPLRAPRAPRPRRTSLRHGPRHRAAVTLPYTSRALGLPNRGSLQGGVVLPASGPDWFTFELPTQTVGSPAWRRVATDTLVTWLTAVLRYFRAQHPGAPRIGIGDLSLPHGGPFGPQSGGLGHASHQNGLDVDVLYPRRDRDERAATTPGQVDRALSQALVDTFVAAGAQFAFVGEHIGLRGPPSVVQVLAHHDDHVHVRIPNLGR